MQNLIEQNLTTAIQQKLCVDASTNLSHQQSSSSDMSPQQQQQPNLKTAQPQDATNERGDELDHLASSKSTRGYNYNKNKKKSQNSNHTTGVSSNPNNQIANKSGKGLTKQTSGRGANLGSNYAANKDKHVNGSSKKPNLNHLLNFTYESRDESNYYEYERVTKQFWSTKLNKNSCFSKEQFLQANCQFVVKEADEDYSVHLADPDLLVDWAKIEQVLIDTSEPIACPICLYEPVAAKMTKCGHIYCWSCILHYLSLSDKAWRKCPICYESVYKNDLKSVQVIRHQMIYKLGDQIQLNLMFKSKTKFNNLILPFSKFDEYKGDEQRLKLNLLNSSKYSQCSQYFKLHCKSASQIYEQVLKSERKQLDEQVELERHQPEVIFVQEALDLLSEREKRLIEEMNQKSIPQKEQDEISDNQLIRSDLVEPPSVADASKSYKDLSFFYQSTDGQRIYLNALNTRCLSSEYSTLAHSPLVISGRIVATESLFMTEENRKKYRYLSHLPLHSEFKIVELDLRDPYLSKKTLDLFSEEIEERKRWRERKETRDKRNADRIAAMQSNEPHYYVKSAMIETFVESSNVISSDYLNEFPEASTSPTHSCLAGSVGESTASSSVSSSEQNNQASFAQMLKHPSAKEELWPTLAATNTTSSNHQVTSSWLKMVKQQAQESMLPGRAKKCQGAPVPLHDPKASDSIEHNEEAEEAMPAPMYQKSFFSAIDESLKMIESKKITENALQPGNTEQQSKKKKKGKQLLFSTSMNMNF